MRTETLYHVVFSGSAAAGREREEVRARLVELFGSPAKVDALFAGGRVLVKRYVREEDARRYQRAFAAAGAPCELVPVELQAGPAAGGLGKRTIAYGSPAARPRRSTPVYGSPVFADDEAGLAAGAERRSAPPPASAIPDLYLPPAPRDPLPPAAVAAGTAAAAALVSPAVARHLESPFESAWFVPEPRPGAPAPLQNPDASRGAEIGSPDAVTASTADGDQEDGLPSFHRVALAASIDDAARLEAADAALPSLDLRGTSTVDLALPRLTRDPDTGRVVATPPTRPERPGRFAGPGAPRVLGQPRPVGAEPGAPAVAVPVLRGELRGDALDSFTPTMLAALERSRLGLTVIAVSLFAGAALLACGGFGSLLTLNVLGFVGAVGAGAFFLVGGLRLWSALQALTEAVGGGSAAAAVRSLEEQARFFRLWGILQALGLALGLLALVAGLLVGAAAGLFAR